MKVTRAQVSNVAVVMAVGQFAKTGFVVSVAQAVETVFLKILTVNEQVAVLPLKSLAVYTTDVMKPVGKHVPEV